MGDPAADPYGWAKRVGTLVSIPMILAVSPVVGGAIGWALDRFLGSRPVFTLILLCIGFAAGVRETWSLIRKASSEEEDRKPSS